ncbi:unnamed protein product [Rotaria magnacalcarata]|uniref:Uncharacterized protein n=1 Tax=Rotaria magnacalcarata TaxID=392030 RepID=A0A820AHQ3_9BILA|nr:unnamed protein product [Rotaria magnacalcarata]CAF4204640.1 unnamed protein product [Rotaria magnacalcarata]
MVDTLRRGASLKLLRLSGNPIGDDGADLLAELLHEKPDALTGLWLSNTALTNRGVQLLMEALEHPQSTLEILDLSDNKNVTDESVDSILEMFMVNKKLNNLRYANILSGKKQNHLKELYGGKVAFLTFSDSYRGPVTRICNRFFTASFHWSENRCIPEPKAVIEVHESESGIVDGAAESNS